MLSTRIKAAKTILRSTLKVLLCVALLTWGRACSELQSITTQPL